MRNLGFVFLAVSLVLILLLIPSIGTNEKASAILGEEFNTREARLFPYMISGILGVLSVLLIAGARLDKSTTSREKDSGSFPWRRIKDVVILLVICVLYVFLLDPVGFILTTPLCLAACMRFFGSGKWTGLLVLPLLVTGVIFVCFEILMRIELPKGLLEWIFY